jgi:hypothetical protein
MANCEYHEPSLSCNHYDGEGVGSHRVQRREVLEKVQNTSTTDILQVFHACLHAPTFYFRNCLATVRVILPPSAAIHTDGDVNS